MGYKEYNETREFRLYVHALTEKAALCSSDERSRDDDKFWLPLSKVVFGWPPKKGDYSDVVMPQWLVAKTPQLEDVYGEGVLEADAYLEKLNRI